MDKAQNDTDKAAERTQSIEDLPVESEQAAEVKAGVIPLIHHRRQRQGD